MSLFNSLVHDLAKQIAPDTTRQASFSLLEWCHKYRTYLRSGQRFDMERHHYLRAIYQSEAQKLVCRKGAQLGWTEYCVSYAFWSCDQRRADVLYVGPDDGHVSDFSRTRIGGAVAASDYLDSIMVSGFERGADRVTLKRVRDSYLYMRGATISADGGSAKLKGTPADVLILDELDEMDHRAPSLAEKRLGASELAEQRWGSTPTYPGTGIDAAYQDSDQRHWMVRCPACRRHTHFQISQLVTEWDEHGRPTRWHQKDGVPYLACPACAAPLDRSATGEWVPAFPDHSTQGYHIDKLMVARHSLSDLLTNLSDHREHKRKEAHNQDLGMPYKPSGVGLDRAALMACIRPELPWGRRLDTTRPCFMGVDVGSVDLIVVIREGPHPETGERPLLFAAKVADFSDLSHLVSLYGVGRVVVDYQPETRAARDWQASQKRGQVWLCHYTAHQGTKKAEPVSWDRGQGRVTAERTRTLDETVARFADEVNTLPPNIPDVPHYFAEVMAPTRKVEANSRGDLVARYVEVGPDHYAHAENYCTIASLLPLSTGVFL